MPSPRLRVSLSPGRLNACAPQSVPPAPGPGVSSADCGCGGSRGHEVQRRRDFNGVRVFEFCRGFGGWTLGRVWGTGAVRGFNGLDAQGAGLWGGFGAGPWGGVKGQAPGEGSGDWALRMGQGLDHREGSGDWALGWVRGRDFGGVRVCALRMVEGRALGRGHWAGPLRRGPGAGPSAGVLGTGSVGRLDGSGGLSPG